VELTQVSDLLKMVELASRPGSGAAISLVSAHVSHMRLRSRKFSSVPSSSRCDVPRMCPSCLRLARPNPASAVHVQDRQVPPNIYPRWEYFPRNVRPPEWVEPLVAEVRAIELRVSTVEQGTGLHSEMSCESSPQARFSRRVDQPPYRLIDDEVS
jgi:hypothetical protein